MTRLNVSFPDPLVAELRRLVPRRRRSEFIAEAVRARLTLLCQGDAVAETAGCWSNEGRGDPSAELRELRSQWDHRQTERRDG